MKKLFIFLTFTVFSTLLYSQVFNKAQIIKTDYWVYEDLNKLCKEQNILVFNENSMLSVGELNFYFEQIDYEGLSETGKIVYENLWEFFHKSGNLLKKINTQLNTKLLDDSAFIFDTNLIVNPEFYYKSNEDIDWSFNYFVNDNFITVPLRLGFNDYVALENDLFIGKSYCGSKRSDNFSNIPYREDDLEFLFNRFGYGSFGMSFENWGFNLQIAKEGLRIGNSQLASIIYNNTFETDGFFQLNLYSRSAKYSLDVVQVDFNKYLYLHQLEFIVLNKLKFAIIEGSQVCEPFQIRFLNPFLFMHQLSGWNDYTPENSVYGEEKFCAYFAWLLEWTPVKNVRLYAMYSQNEIQPPNEQTSATGKLYPDSLGLQIGADVSIPSTMDGYWNINLEGVYTSPYLYIKHTPEASLYRTRNDNLHSENINTWIGSPFGPDSMGGKLYFGYESIGKWKAGISYLFVAKGEKDFSLFEYTQKNVESGEEYYNYYPPVNYHLNNSPTYDYEKTKEDARNMLPSGIVQFTNQIGLTGEYRINEFIKFNGQALYSIIYNSKHKSGSIDNGIELSISMTYNLF